MNGDAPFAYSGLERIFHERGRLAVCTCLVANAAGMRFTELQEACALTDGTRDGSRPARNDRAHHRRRTNALSRVHR
jgi:hypothetical protein